MRNYIYIMSLFIPLVACDNDELNTQTKESAQTKNERKLSSYDMSVALMRTDQIPLIEDMVRSGYCDNGCSEEIYFSLDSSHVPLDFKVRQISVLLKGNNDLGPIKKGIENHEFDHRMPQKTYGHAHDPLTLISRLPYDLIKVLLESGKIDPSTLNKNLWGIVHDSDRKEYPLSDDQTIELFQFAERHGVDLSKPDYGFRTAWPDFALYNGKPKTFQFLVSKGCPIGKDYTYFSYAGLISKLGNHADPNLQIFKSIKKLGGNPSKRNGNGLNAPENAIYTNENNQDLIVKVFARAGVRVDKNRIKKASDGWNSYISSRRLECAKLAEKWNNAVIKGITTGYVHESEDFRMPLYCKDYQ